MYEVQVSHNTYERYMDFRDSPKIVSNVNGTHLNDYMVIMCLLAAMTVMLVIGHFYIQFVRHVPVKGQHPKAYRTRKLFK